MTQDNGASDDRALASEATTCLQPTAFDPSRIADADWHVLAQNVANYWSKPEEKAIAYQAAAHAMEPLRREMERWDRNEHRNCVNWGPCSRNDGRMSAGPQDIAQEVQP
jgi:hypothetical protein